MTEPQESKPLTGSTEPVKGASSDRPLWYEKYLEKFIGSAIAVFLVGVVSWAFGHFATKIEHIENTIAAHHGPEWEKIEKVVAVGNLRSEFLQAKSEYELKLNKLEHLVSENDEKLQKALDENKALLVALRKWAEAADKLVMESRSREYEAYAHLTNHAQQNSDVALLNTAHIGGTRFKIGDRIVLTNKSSGLSEQATVTIAGAYSDLNNTDVLVQLAKKPADLLGLSETLGRIKVLVKREEPDPNDPKRWKTIDKITENLALTRP